MGYKFASIALIALMLAGLGCLSSQGGAPPSQTGALPSAKAPSASPYASANSGQYAAPTPVAPAVSGPALGANDENEIELSVEAGINAYRGGLNFSDLAHDDALAAIARNNSAQNQADFTQLVSDSQADQYYKANYNCQLNDLNWAPDSFGGKEILAAVPANQSVSAAAQAVVQLWTDATSEQMLASGETPYTALGGNSQERNPLRDGDLENQGVGAVVSNGQVYVTDAFC